MGGVSNEVETKLILSKPQQSKDIEAFSALIRDNKYQAIEILMRNEKQRKFFADYIAIFMKGAILQNNLEGARYTYLFSLDYKNKIEFVENKIGENNQIKEFLNDMEFLKNIRPFIYKFYEKREEYYEIKEKYEDSKQKHNDRKTISVLDELIKSMSYFGGYFKRQLDDLMLNKEGDKTFDIVIGSIGSYCERALRLHIQMLNFKITNLSHTAQIKLSFIEQAKTVVDKIEELGAVPRYTLEGKDYSKVKAKINKDIQLYKNFCPKLALEQEQDRFTTEILKIHSLVNDNKFQRALNKIENLLKNKYSWKKDERLQLRACEMEARVYAYLMPRGKGNEEIRINKKGDGQKLLTMNDLIEKSCRRFIRDYSGDDTRKRFISSTLRYVLTAIRYNVILLIEFGFGIFETDISKSKRYLEAAKKTNQYLLKEVFPKLISHANGKEIIKWPILKQHYILDMDSSMTFSNCLKDTREQSIYIDNVITRLTEIIEQQKKEQVELKRIKQEQEKADQARDELLAIIEQEEKRRKAERNSRPKRDKRRNRRQQRNNNRIDKQNLKNDLKSEPQSTLDSIESLYSLYWENNFSTALEQCNKKLQESLAIEDKMKIYYIMGEIYLAQYTAKKKENVNVLSDASVNQVKVEEEKANLLKEAKDAFSRSSQLASQGMKNKASDTVSLNTLDTWAELVGIGLEQSQAFEKEEQLARKKPTRHPKQHDVKANTVKPQQRKTLKKTTKDKLPYKLNTIELPPVVKSCEIKVSHFARFVDDSLRDHNFSSFLVGGAVRDSNLNKPISDEDFVTNASLQDIQAAIYSLAQRKKYYGDVRVEERGKKYPIIVVIHREKEIEVATFRNQTRRLDAKTRDLTINAIYYDIREKKQYCYFDGSNNGFLDLEKGVIRLIGDPIDKLTQDPMRIVRSLRTKTKLRFVLEPNLIKAIFQTADGIEKEDKGRKFHELKKSFLLSGKALDSFSDFLQYELLKYFFVSFRSSHVIFEQELILIKLMLARYDALREENYSLFFAVMLWPEVNRRCYGKILNEGYFVEICSDILTDQIKLIYISPELKTGVSKIWYNYELMRLSGNSSSMDSLAIEFYNLQVLATRIFNERAYERAYMRQRQAAPVMVTCYNHQIENQTDFPLEEKSSNNALTSTGCVAPKNKFSG